MIAYELRILFVNFIKSFKMVNLRILIIICPFFSGFFLFCRTKTILLALHSYANRNNCEFTSSYFHIIKNAAIFVLFVAQKTLTKKSVWNVAFKMRMHREKIMCASNRKYVYHERKRMSKAVEYYCQRELLWRKKRNRKIDSPAVHSGPTVSFCVVFVIDPVVVCLCGPQTAVAAVEHALSEMLGYKL